MTLDIQIINGRVDKALADNRRAEWIIIGLAIAIFILGISILVVGYWQENLYVSGGSLVFDALLYWPIREILKLRRDNIILQTLPAMVTSLSAERAADEIAKFLEYLRK